MDQTKRILVISYLFPNSVYPNRGIFVLRRLKAIQRYADVKVINPILWFPFCSRLQRYKDYDRIPKKEVIDGIEVYHPRFLSIPLVFKFIVAVTYCLAVLPIALRLRKTWKFNLVDLHWTFPDLPVGRLLSRLLRVNQLTTIRGMAGLHLNEFSIPSLLVRYLLPKSNHVITLSDRLKDICISRGVSEDKIQTIRNGVDGNRFDHLDQTDCRDKLELSHSNRIILGVGYCTPNKGFDRIIRALPEIVQQYPETHLYLIGPNGAFAQGDCSEELKQLAEELEVVDHVHFVGEVTNKNLSTWYNASDCFCLSSRSEGCPNVLLEALACGCPVVATDVGSVPELVEDSSMGNVVRNSKEGVQSGLLSVLSQSHDRKAIATRMRKYDWDWCARQVVHIYKRLVHEPRDHSAECHRAANLT